MLGAKSDNLSSIPETLAVLQKPYKSMAQKREHIHAINTEGKDAKG